jgi:pimeloyl-ACP methyl ester carboxylesterase
VEGFVLIDQEAAMAMKSAALDGLKLEYEDEGSGEPILMIHGASVAETFAPLMKEPALGRYRRIRYHRRGYAGSDRPGRTTNFFEQAADAAALLRHLGIAKAHVAGHSYGGLTALRLALDTPEVVHSLVLLEPPMLATPLGAAFFEGPLGPVIAAYQGGDKEKAADLFRDAVGGPNAARALAERLGPGARAQATRDADTLFGTEFPDMQKGLFTELDAAGIGVPVLSVIGEASDPLFQGSHTMLMKWLANADALVIPGAAHFLQVEEPRAVAEGIAAFVARHRI